MQFNGTAVNNMLKKAKSINLFGKEINLANLGVLPADFYLNLKAMEQQGTANVTSRPLIATLNGHKATLSVGTTQYFLLKTTTPYVNQLQTSASSAAESSSSAPSSNSTIMIPAG
jgi:type IV pilus assembly protein PilQ